MTASNVNATKLTNLIASPQTIGDKLKGKQIVAIDKIALETTSVDEIGDSFTFGILIPSNAIITSVKILNDDLDAHATPTIAANVGLVYSGIGHNNSKVIGDAADVDVFATAVTTLQAANVTPVELRFEADDIVDIVKEAWDACGIASDPGGFFLLRVTLTAAAATAAAGDVVAIVEYLAN